MKKYLSNVLFRKPRAFDILKKLDQQLFGIKDDSKILHLIASQYGLNEVLQIGANDGIRNDPVRSLLVKYRPKAILVEPDPAAYALLTTSYGYLIKQGVPIKLINAFVSSGGGDYYSLSQFARSKMSMADQAMFARKSGFSKNSLLNYLRSAGYKDPEELVDCNPIPVVSVCDLLKMTSPDLVVIDTEGLDWKLLAEFHESAANPIAIYFECGHSSQWDTDLIERYKECGYQFSSFKHNAIFIKSRLACLSFM